MRNCLKCNENIPSKAVIDGKLRNFQRRKYCLICSPFGSGNTRKLELPKPPQKRTSDRYYKWQKKVRRERKQKLVDMFGGCCKICGYKKTLRSLCFHHRDPKEKLFTIATQGLLRKWEVLVEEAKKCDLLCLNCHGEVHELEELSGYLAELD